MSELSTYAERRPERSAHDRATIATRYAEHLPETSEPISVKDNDILAMRAAFICHFDENLPRTETLMAVAAIGYRMALRDLNNPKD